MPRCHNKTQALWKEKTEKNCRSNPDRQSCITWSAETPLKNYRLITITFKIHPIWVQYWFFGQLILIIPSIGLLKLPYGLFGFQIRCLQIWLDSLTNFICSSLINPNDQTWHPVYEIWNDIITHFWTYSAMNQLFQIGEEKCIRQINNIKKKPWRRIYGPAQTMVYWN